MLAVTPAPELLISSTMLSVGLLGLSSAVLPSIVIVLPLIVKVPVVIAVPRPALASGAVRLTAPAIAAAVVPPSGLALVTEVAVASCLTVTWNEPFAAPERAVAVTTAGEPAGVLVVAVFAATLEARVNAWIAVWRAEVSVLIWLIADCWLVSCELWVCSRLIGWVYC